MGAERYDYTGPYQASGGLVNFRRWSRTGDISGSSLHIRNMKWLPTQPFTGLGCQVTRHGGSIDSDGGQRATSITQSERVLEW